MVLTIESVVQRARGARPRGRRWARSARAVAHGSLMGARGNSGVILSQLLRGLTAVPAARHEDADDPDLAARPGPRRRRWRARRSCARSRGRSSRSPRAGGEGAQVARAGADLCELVRGGPRRRPQEALRTTPDQLAGARSRPASSTPAAPARPVLRRAVPRRRRARIPTAASARPPTRRCRCTSHVQRRACPSEARSPICATRSCTSSTLPTTRSRPSRRSGPGIGDSIVVVGGEGIYNCHIHTDDIGAAIEAALDAGRRATSASPT